MIFIVVKFKVKPEWSERWLGLVDDFTQSTRKEPGNLWFDWSRSVDDPHEFVLVEAFHDDGAVPHVTSDHFKKALQVMPQALSETPRIINTDLSVQKAINFSGGKSASVKIEMVNLFGRPQLAGFSSLTQGSSTFGVINSQAGFMRMTQIMFRLSF